MRHANEIGVPVFSVIGIDSRGHEHGLIDRLVEAKRRYYKESYGGITADIERDLKNEGINKLVVTGYDLMCCISETVKKSLLFGLEVIMSKDTLLTGKMPVSYIEEKLTSLRETTTFFEVLSDLLDYMDLITSPNL